MVSLILVERHPPIQSSPIKDVDRSSTSNIFLCLPQEILGSMHLHIMHCILTIFSFSGFLTPLLFISKEMALEQNIKGLQAQNTQLQEMFRNLFRRQEELKVLLARDRAERNSEDNKDQLLEQLRTEVETMRIQMLGQMALIQGLARGQEELRTIINKLHQDGYNRMKQAVEAGDQVIDQPPRRQEFGLVKSGTFQITTTSRV